MWAWPPSWSCDILKNNYLQHSYFISGATSTETEDGMYCVYLERVVVSKFLFS